MVYEPMTIGLVIGLIIGVILMTFGYILLSLEKDKLMKKQEVMINNMMKIIEKYEKR